jgi:hypothetical protein
MTEKTDDLRDIFVEVTDEQTITERQQEGASKDPVDAETAAAASQAARSVREDGLDDAVAGAEAGVDGASA